MQHFQAGLSRHDMLPSPGQSLSDVPPRLTGGGNLDDSNIVPRLSEYPWFHGMLARSDAAAMVLHQSVTGQNNAIYIIHLEKVSNRKYKIISNYIFGEESVIMTAGNYFIA